MRLEAMLAQQTRSIVAAPPDPGAAISAYDVLVYIGGGVAAVLAGVVGYFRGKPSGTTQQTTVLGALVDNTALQPLLNRLDALTAILARDVELREAFVAEEKRQADLEAMAETVTERIARLLRESDAAELPKIRDR
jgi:hypothetical protein